MAHEGKKPQAIICPSLLSGDFAMLANEAKRMLELGADWLHMDVMVVVHFAKLLQAHMHSVCACALT